ncbi:lipopolysaccharide assembly protein LapA domain-containing protein [Aureimonas pseudogalii]|uniref:Putative integral membrane protein n=1 Tax=Aureimonas pseudogalii TaxID=1744844 RepID=A0A7W6EAK3_9HYPH|nr:lipopolysaccharide assembly protein LapA domain-containing protein [Aureimonas pseudogalii]MBB3997777.1 putative integral membrane protein [Aureimonas pseudogalii]
MISKIVSFIVLVPLAILLVVFCVANREDISVSLDPIGTLPQLAFQAPLFVLLIGSLIAGLLLGGLGTWMTQSHYRAKSARRRREVENLRHEVELSNERLRRLREERDREDVAKQAALANAMTPASTSRALTGPGVAA